MADVKHPRRQAKRRQRAALRCMFNLLYDEPQMSATRLAEETAWALGRDAWLDDETHWIWELAAQMATRPEGD